MSYAGIAHAAGTLSSGGEGSSVTLPPVIVPASQIVEWVYQAIEAALSALNSAAAKLAALAAQASALLEKAKSLLHEARKVVDAMKKFFEDAAIDPAQIQSRSELYLEGAAAAATAGDVGSDALASLNQAWEGEAAAAAGKQVSAWAVLGPRIADQLAAMSQATMAAGAGFADGRQQAENCMTESQAAIRAAVPDPAQALSDQGWGWLIPGAALARAAVQVAQQITHMVAVMCSEIATLARRIVERSKPGIMEGSRQLGNLDRLGSECEAAAQSLLTGQSVPPAPPTGRFAAGMRGRGNHAEDATMLQLCAALDPKTAPMPAGYREITPEDIGVTAADPRYAKFLKDDELGFQAHIVRGPDGRIVVVTEGTDGDKEGQDWAENLTGSARYSYQSAKVQDIVDALEAKGLAKDAVFTGHSLGGRLATVGAAATGHPAVTFNAAGMSDASYAFYAGQRNTSVDAIHAEMTDGGGIRAYRTNDDILTWAQETKDPENLMHDAAGNHIDLEGTTGKPSVKGHLLPNVLDSYMKKYHVTIPTS